MRLIKYYALKTLVYSNLVLYTNEVQRIKGRDDGHESRVPQL